MVMLQGDCTVFCGGSPDESITWAVKEKDPVAVGVPLSSPVEGFSPSPVGNAPAVE